MKTYILITTLLFSSIFITACGNNEDSLDKNSTGQYQCPMECEGDSLYTSPGKCPVCEMDLQEK